MSTATKLAVIVGLVATAHAGVLHDLAHDVAARIAALPKGPVAPVPVAVVWKPQRLTPSLELGAPLVAMTAADLDGDGKAELYAVTSKEIIAFEITDHRVKELGRQSFGGERVMPASRDPIGTAIVVDDVHGRAVVASSSLYTRGLIVSWRGSRMMSKPRDGVEICPGEKAVIAAGRNYFGDALTGFYATRCSGKARAIVSMLGHLDVMHDDTKMLIQRSGTAIELADLDRDGKLEILYSSPNAPGDSDEVRAVTLGEDEKKTRWKKAFNAGIAAIAVGEFEGVPVAIVAVRLVGSTRVDLWRMN